MVSLCVRSIQNRKRDSSVIGRCLAQFNAHVYVCIIYSTFVLFKLETHVGISPSPCHVFKLPRVQIWIATYGSQALKRAYFDLFVGWGVVIRDHH